jgi:cephalosporin hydroxylase
MNLITAVLTILAVVILYLAYDLLVKNARTAPEKSILSKVVAFVVLAGLWGLALYQHVRGCPEATVPDDATAIRRFHEYWYDKADTWKTIKWLGVQTEQNPMDVWVYQEIMYETKPDFVIEAGTFHGGSAALWATILAQINPQGRVITIDIVDNVTDAKKLPIVKEKVDFLIGSSTDPKIVAEVEKRVKGKKVLVILDSDHSKAHVLNELKAYSPMVPVGCYLTVQDTNINGHPVYKDFGPGPWEAVEEFMAGNDQFVIDHARENLVFTILPNGYLKRVK